MDRADPPFVSAFFFFLLFFVSLFLSFFLSFFLFTCKCRAKFKTPKNEASPCHTRVALLRILLPLSLRRRPFLALWDTMTNLICSHIERALRNVSGKNIEYQHQLKELEVSISATPLLTATHSDHAV